LIYYSRKKRLRWGNIKEVNKLLKDSIKYGFINNKTSEKLNDIPIIYINMDESVNRKSYMNAQFKFWGIKNYQRIQAVDGKNILIEYENNYPSLTDPELGCTLSHLKAIDYANKRKLKYALIIEDDTSLELLPFWGIDMNYIINNAPKDWEIIQLWTTNKECTDEKKTSLFYKHNDKNPCWGTMAYLINLKGTDTVLNYCKFPYDGFKLGGYEDKPSPKYGRSDQFLYNLCKTYYFTIPLFLAADEMLGSTIHESHEKKHIMHTKNLRKKYLDINFMDYKSLEKQNKFAKSLLDFKEYMDGLKIPFFLMCGTLLGAYREGQFMSWDGDIDTGINADKYDNKIIKGNKNIKFYKKHGDVKKGAEIRMKHKNGTIIDIMLVYKDNDEIWYPSFTGLCDKTESKMCRFSIPSECKMEKIKFLNTEFNAYTPELFLKNHYGINWNIPLKFDYHSGIKDGLYQSLIIDDFPENNKPKKIYNEDNIHDLYPSKLKEYKKPILWLYREQNDLRANNYNYIDMCIDIISKNCEKDYEIILLDDDIFDSIHRKHKSGFRNILPINVRRIYIISNLIEEYGGVHVNIDSIVTDKGLKFMDEDLKKSNFISYGDDDKIFFNIFGGIKGNKICGKIKNIFEKDKSIKDWIDYSTEIKLDDIKSKIEDFLPKIKLIYPKEIEIHKQEDKIYPINVDEFDKSHDLKTPNIIYFENNLGSEDILADHPNIFEIIKGL
tara:strand:- start:6659 stop:8824 length:2166 start_codon:yes stop_codon:yes gene_type:complete